ncbi:MAG: aldehyde ferredoxin oxidoreductase family protein [Deltaproteobacteria bacterium]|nr:aldehyde ferredoxin oxidoreductase family protein [Candidatus Anaeroferrophillus wilburensis]MBN2889005.1 aldehyde ferredoxin oxidoreductase family protein [Deltaproteobacteria bacterium]
MAGWIGTMLRVNLRQGTVAFESLEERRMRDFIGGRGVGVSYMLDEVDPSCDPLGSKNKLIMMTGPLSGTAAPTGARYMVMTKSPLTGAITCSNAGGHFPAMMKKAGIDGIIIEESSSSPVYLWVADGRAELRSADHLWGKNVHETDDLLKKETHPEARTACIGPAGERQVLFAAIMNDRDRAAGRSGVGAVLGAKKLKGVVIYGTGDVPLDDQELFTSLARGFLDKFRDSCKGEVPGLRQYGTAKTITGTQGIGVLPTRNFQQGRFEHWQHIGGEALTEQFLVKAKACYSCPIACGRVTRIADGPFAGEGEGPEYETIYALGSNCGIGDLGAITKANYICNEMGMDTISMGSTIACAMEMYEKGILSAAEIGRPLPFGDAEAVVDLCRQTALREGFGDRLAAGSLRLARSCGHEELAIVAKGQEFAGYDPRGEKGMGLAYATSNIGASHMRGDPAYIEILGVPMLVDPLSWEDKPQLVKDWQDVFAVIDAAGLCVFFSVRNYVTQTRDIRPEGILELLNAATGAGYTMSSLMQCGERIVNAERLFLVGAGFDAKDDRLPIRIVKEPLPDGPAQGQVCELERMLPLYYSLRGWTADGIPQAKTLEQLRLGQHSPVWK